MHEVKEKYKQAVKFIQEYLGKNEDPYIEVCISADDIKVKRIIEFIPKREQPANTADCQKN